MSTIGAIHISEIKPTLQLLERQLGIPLEDNVLGSVGKKQFSGDIDVAVHIPDDEIQNFMERVRQCDIVESVSRGPLVVISKVKIQNYDNTIATDKKRSGYVQVDFMIDEDPVWLKTFYHSPSDTESSYKGAHRNIVIGALSQYVDRNESPARIDDGRPLSVERYMFSSKKGLVRIDRTPVPMKNGKGFTKQHSNKIIAGPWKTGQEIASQLRLGKVGNLNSFETVFAAIEKNHGEAIAKKVAHDIANDKSIQKLGIPTEIGKYL